MKIRRTHFHVTRSERKRAGEMYARQQARKHKHICEGCETDKPYVCTGAPCQHILKKLCKDCKRQQKYHGTVSATPLMDFKEPPIEVHIGQYADFVDTGLQSMTESGMFPILFAGKGLLSVIENANITPEVEQAAESLAKNFAKSTQDAIEGNLSVTDDTDDMEIAPAFKKWFGPDGKVLKKLCSEATCFSGGECSDACTCECHDDPNPNGL